MINIIVDKFDSSKKLILNINICKTCGRETILVDDMCSLCMENKYGKVWEVTP